MQRLAIIGATASSFKDKTLSSEECLLVLLRCRFILTHCFWVTIRTMDKKKTLLHVLMGWAKQKEPDLLLLDQDLVHMTEASHWGLDDLKNQAMCNLRRKTPSWSVRDPLVSLFIIQEKHRATLMSGRQAAALETCLCVCDQMCRVFRRCRGMLHVSGRREI